MLQDFSNRMSSVSSNGSNNGCNTADFVRKQREFIPDNKKDQKYWERRRKNNDAAKRSREKRRMNDAAVERKIAELKNINYRLLRELNEIKARFGIPIDNNSVSGVDISPPVQSFNTQVKVNDPINTMPTVPSLVHGVSLCEATPNSDQSSLFFSPAVTSTQNGFFTSSPQSAVAYAPTYNFSGGSHHTGTCGLIPSSTSNATPPQLAYQSQGSPTEFLGLHRLVSPSAAAFLVQPSPTMVSPQLAAAANLLLQKLPSNNQACPAFTNSSYMLHPHGGVANILPESYCPSVSLLQGSRSSENDRNYAVEPSERQSSVETPLDLSIHVKKMKTAGNSAFSSVNAPNHNNQWPCHTDENGAESEGSEACLSSAEPCSPTSALISSQSNSRYQERRRRNNEAVRRCRENKRVRSQMREEVSGILETENRKLRLHLECLNTEVMHLKSILIASKSTSSPTLTSQTFPSTSSAPDDEEMAQSQSDSSPTADHHHIKEHSSEHEQQNVPRPSTTFPTTTHEMRTSKELPEDKPTIPSAV